MSEAEARKIMRVLGEAENRFTASLTIPAYSSDREQRFHAMVNGAWGGQLESEFLR
jgi:uncharacterized protein (DUF1810 family)